MKPKPWCLLITQFVYSRGADATQRVLKVLHMYEKDRVSEANHVERVIFVFLFLFFSSYNALSFS